MIAMTTMTLTNPQNQKSFVGSEGMQIVRAEAELPFSQIKGPIVATRLRMKNFSKNSYSGIRKSDEIEPFII